MYRKPESMASTETTLSCNRLLLTSLRASSSSWPCICAASSISFSRRKHKYKMAQQTIETITKPLFAIIAGRYRGPDDFGYIYGEYTCAILPTMLAIANAEERFSIGRGI